MGMIIRREASLLRYDGKELPSFVACLCFECGSLPHLHLSVERYDTVRFSVGCFQCGLLFFGSSRAEAVERWNRCQRGLEES